MSTIKRILAQPHTEVFINLMSREINRFVGVSHQDNNFDALFGTTDWRKAIQYKGEVRNVFLRDLYISILMNDKTAKYVFPFKICEDNKCATLYHLVYATNNFKGIDVMKDIMYKQSNEFAYLGPNERDSQFRQAQITLFDDTEYALKEFLLKTYSPGTVRTFDQIRMDTYTLTPSISRHYRDAIKSLRNDGKVSIQLITSKKTGLSGNDLITFL